MTSAIKLDNAETPLTGGCTEQPTPAQLGLNGSRGPLSEFITTRRLSCTVFVAGPAVPLIQGRWVQDSLVSILHLPTQGQRSCFKSMPQRASDRLGRGTAVPIPTAALVRFASEPSCFRVTKLAGHRGHMRPLSNGIAGGTGRPEQFRCVEPIPHPEAARGVVVAQGYRQPPHRVAAMTAQALGAMSFDVDAGKHLPLLDDPPRSYRHRTFGKRARPGAIENGPAKRKICQRPQIRDRLCHRASAP